MTTSGPSAEDLAKRESELLTNASAPSTNRTRACQARRYERFCDDYNFEYTPCDPPRICTYIAFLSFFMTYSSISNYLSGLSHYLKARGRQGVDYANFTIRSSLNGARRICQKGRGKAPGIFPKDLLDIVMELNMSNVNDLVFWAALTLAFRCLLWVSNYCKSRHCILIMDLNFSNIGMVVNLLSSKTNQFNEFVTEIPVYANSDSVLCPIQWIKRMLSLRSQSGDKMLFMIFGRGKWTPMTASWFNKRLREVSRLPGVSSHGLCRGGATYMLQNKFKLAEVKQRGQWKSACVYEYLSLPTDQAMRRDMIFSLSLP